MATFVKQLVISNGRITSGTAAQIALDADVTGILPLANGGTGASLSDPNADRILFWDDSAGTLTWLAAGTGLTITDTTITADAGAGYTDEQAQDAVGTILTDSATIDFTYDDATPSITAGVKDDSITYAKLQNASATQRILARKTAGAGDYEESTIGDVLDFIASIAVGDLIFRDSGGWSRLPVGTENKVLSAGPTNPLYRWLPGELLGASWVQTQQSTTSSTPVDLTTTQSLTVEVDEATDIVVFAFCSAVNTGATGHTQAIYLDKDGSDTLIAQSGNPSTSYVTTLGGGLTTGLTTGSHTLKLQFAATTGGTAFFSDRIFAVFRKSPL